MGRLDGKVALVTGAGGGIGRETCIKLAREGAKVVSDESSFITGSDFVVDGGITAAYVTPA